MCLACLPITSSIHLLLICLDMCILSGCDYLSSMKGTGIKKAFADVKRNKDISSTVRYFQTYRKLDLPVDYETQVNRNLHCFKSQIVIDPLTLNHVLLHGNIDSRTGKFTQSFDISKSCIDCYSIFYFKHKNLAGTTLPLDDQNDRNQVNDDSHAEDDLADVKTHFRTHAVPFKVLRSTHHNGMQAALRAAKKELERPSLVRKDIVARIRPEPDNEKDAKAIVIEITVKVIKQLDTYQEN